MDKTINVAIYVRKSREDETDDVIQRQESVLVDLCKKNGWKYDIYKEVGSSQDLERTELQSMLEKVKGFHYDGIVVADLDRLSRNTGHFGTIKEVLINFGCFVQIPGKVYDFTKQEDDLFSDIQSVLAKNEYQTIKKRLVRGTRQSAKDGNWMGKKVPIGYKYNRDTKRLEPSEDDHVIQRIFQEYIDGLSTTDIASKFNLENVSTTVGMIWTSSGISRLLNNPVYKGDSVYGRTKKQNGKHGVKTKLDEQIIIENTHPAIVNKDMWDKLQKIKLERNSRPLVLKLGKHKFSGLIKCRICGNVHSFQTSRGKNKRITSCQTRHYKGNDFNNYVTCQNKGSNLKEFEKLFFVFLGQHILQFEKYIKLIKSNEQPKHDTVSEQIKSYEKQLKKIDQDIKRVQQGFLKNIFSEEEAEQEINGFKIQRKTIEDEIPKLEAKMNSSNTDYLEGVLKKLTDFFNGHSDMPEVTANQLLRQFVEVIIYKNTDTSKIELDIIWKPY